MLLENFRGTIDSASTTHHGDACDVWLVPTCRFTHLIDKRDLSDHVLLFYVAVAEGSRTSPSTQREPVLRSRKGSPSLRTNIDLLPAGSHFAIEALSSTTILGLNTNPEERTELFCQHAPITDLLGGPEKIILRRASRLHPRAPQSAERPREQQPECQLCYSLEWIEDTSPVLPL